MHAAAAPLPLPPRSLSEPPPALEMAKKGAINRLRKELAALMKDPPPYISVAVSDANFLSCAKPAPTRRAALAAAHRAHRGVRAQGRTCSRGRRTRRTRAAGTGAASSSRMSTRSSPPPS